MSVDYDTIENAFYNWVLAGSGLTSDKVVWSQQAGPRPAGPAIVMRLSNFNESGQAWIDYEPNPLTFANITVTAVDATANTFTKTAHGRTTGDGPVFLSSTGTLPTANGGDIAAATNYWLIAPDANTLQLARTFADTTGTPVPIDLTGTGSGTITIAATADTVAAGAEMRAVSRVMQRVTLELHCHSADGTGLQMATAILAKIKNRRRLPSQQAILQAANIGLIDADRIRAILGVRDALLFEPRAYLDVHFCVPSEEVDFETRVDRVQGAATVSDPAGAGTDLTIDVTDGQS